jgi:hypothetical protein
MSLQYISDNKGKTSGVYIPIQEWNRLKRKYTILNILEGKDEDMKILDDLKDAVNDINLINQGKLKAKSFNEFLDEL